MTTNSLFAYIWRFFQFFNISNLLGNSTYFISELNDTIPETSTYISTGSGSGNHTSINACGNNSISVINNLVYINGERAVEGRPSNECNVISNGKYYYPKNHRLAY